MNRWTKHITIMMIVVIALGFVGSNVAHADDGDGTPTATVPRPGIVRTLADVLLDAAVTATKRAKADVVQQLVDGKTLSEVITTNGATVDAVKSIAKDAVTKQVQQAIVDGKLTQAQADKALGKLDSALDRLLNAKFPAQLTPMGRRLHILGYALLIKETADQTKITQRDLLKQLRDGKTLAQIAESRKVDVTTIVAATVTKATDRINTMVKNGKLKDSQAKTLLTNLQPELTKLMNESALLGRLGKGGRGQGKSGNGVSTPEPAGTPGL